MSQELYMKPIFRFFAGNHMFANIFTIMLLLIGLNSIMSIRKDLLPDVEYSIVTITTVYPKASPEDVEINITNRIESALRNVDGIRDVSSLSIENVSSVSVTLNDSLDERGIDNAVQDIRDAVSRIEGLPSDIEGEPVITRKNAGDRPVIVAGISSKDKPYEQLRHQSMLLERSLRKIPGISRIDKNGYLAREVKIELDPEKIKSFRLDINELVSAVQKRNIMGTAGAMESFSCKQDIVMMSQFAEPGDVGDVIVRSAMEGPLVKVKDLAVVREGYEDEKIISRINGEKVIALNIYKLEGADIVKTVRAVKSSIARFEKNMPGGYSVTLSNDYSRYVDASYRVVAANGIMGFLLVVVILTLFLNFRVSLWVAMGIPVSIFGTITVLQAAGYSLNVISLSALILVIGIIVDDSIIISESIYREFESGKAPLDAASDGLHKVFFPVISSLLTTIAAFFPLLLIPGNFGKFLFVMPLVVIVALCISLLEGIVALPSHVSSSMGKGKKLKERVFVKAAEAMYKKFLTLVLVNRKKTLALSFVILAAVFTLSAKYLKFDSFPLEGAEAMVINLEAPQGCGLKVTASQIEKVERVLLDNPEGEIQSFITTVGKKESSLPKQNYANISINLTPFSKRKRDAVDIANDLREKIDSLSGIGKVTFDIKGAGPSPAKAVSFRIVGNNDVERKKAADTLYNYLAGMEGVIEAERDDLAGKGQVTVNFDYEKLARNGFDVADVLREIRVNYDGEIISSIQYAGEQIDYRLTAVTAQEKDLEFLRNIYLTNKYGKILQLKEIAEFTQNTGLDGFRHYSNERAVTIESDLRRNVTDLKEVNGRLRQKFSSLGLTDTWLLIQGEQQNVNSSMMSFGFTFLVAMIGIYLLLSLQFKSLKMPFLVMLVVPFGIAGIQLVFMIHNAPLTFLGIMGVVGLTGVIVNDSLVMVDRLLQADYASLDTEGRIEEVARGAASRFRAVVLTTVTTAAGVLPLAYGIGGQDYTNAPMALALGWGLVFGTLISLVVLPAMFLTAVQVKYSLFSEK